jgi:subtilisin family serine protease
MVVSCCRIIRCTFYAVGALDKTDTVTYFSNFGQCIDVFAPGLDIMSACAKAVCNDDTSYWTLSGK